MKKYILIAGVNGAGKSTLYQTLHSLHSMERINTDEILKEFGDWRNPKDQIQAGKLAVLKLRKCFDEGLSFNQETTLCGKSILGNIEKAKERKYSIELHYVGVDSAETAKERVAFRVRQGGHGIEEALIEKIRIFDAELDDRVVELCKLVMRDALDMSEDKVMEIMQIAREPASLETPIGEEDDSNLGDFVADNNAVTPEGNVESVMLREHIDSLLEDLKERERQVIVLRFGLEDGHPRTLEEVGKEFNVTRERIRQIEAKALRKLRNPVRSKRIRDFL